MIFSFMSDGIPIVYYGQEQGFSGNADPVNTFHFRIPTAHSLTFRYLVEP